MKIKYLLIMLMALVGISANAQTFEYTYNGTTLKYSVTSGTECEVTIPNTSPSGELSIPEVVTCNNQEYRVTSIGESAFAWCTHLTSVIIPNSVTSIGDYAFNKCTGLVKSAYPKRLRNPFPKCAVIAYDPEDDFIEDGFIYGPEKSSIKFAPLNLHGSYDIPNSVTFIGESAFSSCSGLTSVTIPNSVTSISRFAFSGCSGLTSVFIPNSVYWIGFEAFDGCWGLVKSAYPNGLEDPFYDGGSIAYDPQKDIIENGFIYGPAKSSIKFAPLNLDGSYDIPNSVTSIGSHAFRGCSGLTLVTIPNSVTSIGENAFYDCSGLITVVIGNSVTSIGSGAFDNCSGLEKSAFPQTLNNPFTKGKMLSYNPVDVIVENGFIYGPEKSSIWFAPATLKGDYTIPDFITEIASYAFCSCSRLTSVTIPNSVTYIGSYAFSDCTSINNIIVNAIEPPLLIDSAFEKLFLSNFSGLYDKAKLSFPQSSQNQYLCSNWSLFKSFKASGSDLPVKNYSDGVLDYYLIAAKNASEKNIAIVKKGNYSNLKSVSIPERITADDSQRYYVTGISYHAFLDCAQLKEVVFHNKCALSIIGDEAFYGSAIATITLPETVTSIRKGAFWDCSGLTSITIPNSVTSIGEAAFSGCSGLTSMTIPNSVTSVGESAFSGCSSLSSVSIGSGVKAISFGAFDGCNLSKVVLPPAVETIESSAFANNLNLKEVAMGANITSIGDKAFDQAPVEKVFITTPEPPTASASVFSRYTAKLYVQGNAAVGAYYDALNCWDRFDGYAMSEPQSLTMAEPTTRPLGNAGETFILEATMTPANVDLPYVFWRSTDPTKAYVDNDGKVTVLQDITAEDNLEIIAETLYHNGPVAKFSFYPDSSGVDDIVGDTDAIMDVFTLQGVQVLRNATREQFENLASGIYIVKSGKSVKKIVK